MSEREQEFTPLDTAREEFQRIAGGALRYTNAQRLEDAIRAVVRDELSECGRGPMNERNPE